MTPRLALAIACLALCSCAQPGDEEMTSEPATVDSPRAAPSPEQREREERYIWYSEQA